MSQVRTAIRRRTSEAIAQTTTRALLLSLGIALVITVLVGWIAPERLTETIDADFANLFLATIAQVFGGALAIVFSVSALVVTMIADRYTHQLVSKFATDPLTIITFVALLACTLVALVFIGVSLPMYKWGFLGMIFFVSLGLGLLAQYLFHALHLVKPSTMSLLLSKDGLDALRKQEDEAFFRVISSIGDVVLKAVERGEENVAEDYLRSLHRIHLEWIENDRKPVQGTYDQSLVTLGDQRRSPVINQLKRIFTVLMVKNDENLTRLVEDLSVDGISILAKRGTEELTVRGLLKQRQELAKLAIENRNSSRYGFLHSYQNLIWYVSRVGEDYLRSYLEEFVGFCNEIMVQDDVGLWDHMLRDFLGGYRSINNLYLSIQHELSSPLPLLSRRNFVDIRGWLLAWGRWIQNTLKPRLTPHKWKLLRVSLDAISNSLGSGHSAQRPLRQLNDHLIRINITTHLIDAFFQIGVKALALGKNQYIKTLWQPHDLDCVPPDLGFGVYQIISHVRSERFGFSEPEYHSAVLRYCFLYFAYTLHRATRKEWSPMIPSEIREAILSRYGEFSETIVDDLRDVYRLLTNFQHDIQPILEQYDFIANNHADWDDVFDDNAARAFQDARDWLLDEERQQNWSNATSELIEILPVGIRQRLQCFTRIRRTHRATSRVAQLAEVIPSSKNNAAPEQLDSSVHCDKIHLTVLRDFQPHSDGAFQAAALGGNLATQEEAFIIQTILENGDAHVIDVERLTFSALVAGVTQVRNCGFEPTALITSLEQIHDAFDNDQDFRTHVRPIDNQRQIVIDESTRLLILELLHGVKHALILAPASGHWSVTEPVRPSITVCPNDPLRLHLSAEETVQYQLAHEEGVAILRFSAIPTHNG